MLQKTEGIVLRSHKFSDNKRIVNILTKSSGKKPFVVYQSSKSKKIKANIFQPFFILNLEFNEKKNQQVGYIKEAEISFPFQSILYEPKKTAIVFFLTEIISKIIEDDFVDEKFYNFLRNSILLLENHQKTANFHLSFLATMSIYVGIMPKINYSNKNKYFNIKEGTFCHQFLGQHSIDEYSSKKFYEIIEAGMQNFDRVKLIHSERKNLLKKILDFYTYHYSFIQNLKSLEVLEQIFSS